MNAKRIATAALLLAALAVPVFAANPATEPAATGAPDANAAGNLLRHPKALARFLGLSADQVTQLQGFVTTLENTEKALGEARVPLCARLRTDLGATSPNPTAVGTDVLALVDNKDDRRAAREAFDTSFSAILNPAQLAKYDALKEIAHMGEKGGDLIGECPKPAAS